MEKCVIICRLKLKRDSGINYDTNKSICIGPFNDHESAGEFMRECLDSDKNIKDCLSFVFEDEVISLERWEVADYIDRENVADNWLDHETAQRSTQERGRYNFD